MNSERSGYVRYLCCLAVLVSYCFGCAARNSQGDVDIREIPDVPTDAAARMEFAQAPVRAAKPPAYPSTGVAVHDPYPPPVLISPTLAAPELPTGIHPLEGASAADVIGQYDRGYGYTGTWKEKLTLLQSGAFEYFSSPGCWLSYVGYNGRWEVQDGFIVLTDARPDPTYEKLLDASRARASSKSVELLLPDLPGRAGKAKYAARSLPINAKHC